MKKRVLAGMLAVALDLCLTGALQTKALADTAIIEEDTVEGIEPDKVAWKLQQTVSASSCKQGKDVTLTVTLAGDVEAMQLSTIYATFAYDPKVFKLGAKDVTPVKPGQTDYIAFDQDLGEINIYYANDIRVEPKTELLKIKFHALPGADVGETKLGVKALELYATDSDDYAVIKNKSTVKVNIQKSSPAVLSGDVNGDKKTSLTDVKQIMRYCNHEITLTEVQKKSADVNKDGKVDLKDARLLMMYCNGEIQKF